MAIPDFQTIMLPALQAFASGGEHRVRDLIPGLADHFGLTARERRELLPSGTQARFDNRVHWAASYVKQAGLLQRTGRGLLVITSRGQDILAQHPGRLSVHELERFPEFREFKVRTRAPKSGIGSPMRDSEDVSDPEESLETAWQTLRDQLAQSVLERVRAVTPQFFERVVVDVLMSMGYGGTSSDAAQVVGGSGDGGVDGVIKQDRLGLDAVYVQAKRWDGPVGRPTVQSFAGALDARQSTKGEGGHDYHFDVYPGRPQVRQSDQQADRPDRRRGPSPVHGRVWRRGRHSQDVRSEASRPRLLRGGVTRCAALNLSLSESKLLSMYR